MDQVSNKRRETEKLELFCIIVRGVQEFFSRLLGQRKKKKRKFEDTTKDFSEGLDRHCVRRSEPREDFFSSIF